MIDTFGGMGAGAINYSLLDGFIFALLFRREVAIGFSFFNKLSRRCPMLFGVVRLEDKLFVVIKLEPFQAFEDRARGFVRRTLQVSVFDAQQKFAAHLAGKQPIEERRARRADV